MTLFLSFVSPFLSLAHSANDWRGLRVHVAQETPQPLKVIGSISFRLWAQCIQLKECTLCIFFPWHSKGSGCFPVAIYTTIDSKQPGAGIRTRKERKKETRRQAQREREIIVTATQFRGDKQGDKKQNKTGDKQGEKKGAAGSKLWGDKQVGS